MIKLPYELRFVQAKYNYLFVGGLYLALAVLVMIKIILIEDRFNRRPLLILGLMLVVFPCCFVFSVALENFYRVASNNGIDQYFELTAQTTDGQTYWRTYKARDENILEISGLVLMSRKSSSSYYTPGGLLIFPTKTIVRQEKDIHRHLKLIINN